MTHLPLCILLCMFLPLAAPAMAFAAPTEAPVAMRIVSGNVPQKGERPPEPEGQASLPLPSQLPSGPGMRISGRIAGTPGGPSTQTAPPPSDSERQQPTGGVIGPPQPTAQAKPIIQAQPASNALEPAGARAASTIPMRLTSTVESESSEDLALLITRIKTLEAEGKQDQLCALLKTLLSPSGSINQRNEIHFYRAQCASRESNFDGAIREYKAILMTRPETGPIWLEYAKLLVRKGKTSEALAAFSKVLKSNPPEKIRAFVMAEMSAINGKGILAPFGNGRLSFGYIFDSNVNSATAASEVMLWGVPLVLDTKPVSAQAQQVSGTYSLTKMDNGHQWYLDLAGSFTSYNSHDEFNQGSASVSGGTRVPFGAFLADVPLHIDYLNVGGKPFRLGGGILPKLFWNPESSNWIFSLGGMLDWQYFPKLEGKDGMLNALSFGVKKMALLSPSDYLEAEASGGMTTQAEGSGTRSLSSALRYNFSGELFSFSGEYQFNVTDHDQPDPMFGEKRQDEGQVLSVSLMRKCFGFICSANYIHQATRSSIPLYSYDRDVFTLQLNWLY